MVFGGVPICLLFAVVICRGYCLEGVLWWVFDGVSGCYQEGVLWGVMEGSLSNIVGAGVKDIGEFARVVCGGLRIKCSLTDINCNQICGA